MKNISFLWSNDTSFNCWLIARVWTFLICLHVGSVINYIYWREQQKIKIHFNNENLFLLYILTHCKIVKYFYIFGYWISNIYQPRQPYLLTCSISLTIWYCGFKRSVFLHLQKYGFKRVAAMCYLLLYL